MKDAVQLHYGKCRIWGFYGLTVRITPPLAETKTDEQKLTPLGEKTPSVPPSSLMDTPISASRASLRERERQMFYSCSSQTSSTQNINFSNYYKI